MTDDQRTKKLLEYLDQMWKDPLGLSNNDFLWVRRINRTLALQDNPCPTDRQAEVIVSIYRSWLRHRLFFAGPAYPVFNRDAIDRGNN